MASSDASEHHLPRPQKRHCHVITALVQAFTCTKNISIYWRDGNALEAHDGSTRDKLQLTLHSFDPSLLRAAHIVDRESAAS